MRRAKGAVRLVTRSGPARIDRPQKSDPRRGSHDRRLARMGAWDRLDFPQVVGTPNAAAATSEIGPKGVDQMENFEDSTAGRLLTLAVIVPLAAGASVTWDDGRAGSIVIMGSIAIGTFLA